MWLKKQKIKTMCDFNDHAHWRWALSEEQKVLTVSNASSKEVYVSEDEKACKKAEWSECCNEGNNRGAIASLNSKEILKVQHDEESNRITELQEEVCILNEKEFHIRDCMINEAACAACDGSNKDHIIG